MLIPKDDRKKIVDQLQRIKGVTLARVLHHSIYVVMPIKTTNEAYAELVCDLAAMESYYDVDVYVVPTHITTIIKPSDFDIVSSNNKVFHNINWRMECNWSARWLVMLAQKHQSWRNFTKKEINYIYRKQFEGDDFWFNELIDHGWIKQNANKTYSFTDEFIITCWNCRQTKKELVRK